MTTYTQLHSFTSGSLIYSNSTVELYEATWDFSGEAIAYYQVSNLVRLKATSRVRTRVFHAVATESRHFRHPNLPDILGCVGPTEKDAGIFMRLPKGKLLLPHIDETNGLAPALTLKILRGVAKALRSYRNQGAYPHRGPTADRVWVSDQGDPILLGWGEVLNRNDLGNVSARLGAEMWWHLPPEVLEDAGDSSTETRRLTHVGTDQLASLESAEEAEVWVAGCLAYHCLAGHHPYYQTGRDHAYGVENTLKSIRLPLPPTASFLGPVIDRALSHSPQDRFASVEEFIEAFAEVLNPGENVAEEFAAPAMSKPFTLPVETLRDDESDLLAQHHRDADRKAAELRSRLWMTSAIALFCAFIFLIVVDRRRPYTLLITSEPNGIEIAEVTGHLNTPRGRTPLLLSRRTISDPITLRTVGPEGDLGAPLTLDPGEFDDLGRCVAAQIIPEIVPVQTTDDEDGGAEGDAVPGTDDTVPSDTENTP